MFFCFLFGCLLLFCFVFQIFIKLVGNHDRGIGYDKTAELGVEWASIRIFRPCNLYLLTPNFYIVKLGFTGVYIFFALKL